MQPKTEKNLGKQFDEDGGMEDRGNSEIKRTAEFRSSLN